jgi:lipocalin-like protein
MFWVYLMNKIIIFILMLCSFSCVAEEPIANKLIGTWKLVSVTHTQVSSDAEIEDDGPHPKGYLNYSSDGHVMVMMIRGDRIKPKGNLISPDEAKNLIKSMTSYAGTYQIINDKIIHNIDISWNETWSGTRQVRYYKLKGNQLTLTMDPFMDPKYGKIVVHLLWEKL